MSTRNGLGTRITATALLLVATATPAFAYIDPGTGSMLIQLAAASVAGAIFFVRDLPTRLAAWFSRIRTRNQNSSPEPGE